MRKRLWIPVALLFISCLESPNFDELVREPTGLIQFSVFLPAPFLLYAFFNQISAMRNLTTLPNQFGNVAFRAEGINEVHKCRLASSALYVIRDIYRA